jgi:hypothetical protein
MDTHVYEPCEQLSSTDLSAIAAEELDQGGSVEMAVITIVDETGYLLTESERGEALYLPTAGRIGISWGANADWADADSLEEGIRLNVDEPEEYEHRN